MQETYKGALIIKGPLLVLLLVLGLGRLCDSQLDLIGANLEGTFEKDFFFKLSYGFYGFSFFMLFKELRIGHVRIRLST
jgi:hypothetical protein